MTSRRSAFETRVQTQTAKLVVLARGSGPSAVFEPELPMSLHAVCKGGRPALVRSRVARSAGGSGKTGPSCNPPGRGLLTDRTKWLWNRIVMFSLHLLRIRSLRLLTRRDGVESLAVFYLFSFQRAAHELRTREIASR